MWLLVNIYNVFNWKLLFSIFLFEFWHKKISNILYIKMKTEIDKLKNELVDIKEENNKLKDDINFLAQGYHW